jgi:hypothetical protein
MSPFKIGRPPSQPTTLPPRPKKQTGRIIDLAAPAATAVAPVAEPGQSAAAAKVRSYTDHSFHLPDSFSREDSAWSQQNQALLELQKLREELLGERKQHKQAVIKKDNNAGGIRQMQSQWSQLQQQRDLLAAVHHAVTILSMVLETC